VFQGCQGTKLSNIRTLLKDHDIIRKILGSETESSLRNVVLNKMGRWIMARKSVIILVYHHHELYLLDNIWNAVWERDAPYKKSR
jgi:hypothetical protein